MKLVSMNLQMNREKRERLNPRNLYESHDGTEYLYRVEVVVVVLNNERFGQNFPMSKQFACDDVCQRRPHLPGINYILQFNFNSSISAGHLGSYVFRCIKKVRYRTPLLVRVLCSLCTRTWSPHPSLTTKVY